MKSLVSLVALVALLGASAALADEQAAQPGQRILRRVIKSTPTATNLARIRMVQVRSATAEKGVVTEISGKEAANFGRRAGVAAALVAEPEVINSAAPAAPATKSKQPASSTTTSTTSAPTSSTTTTSTTTAPTTTAAGAASTTSQEKSVSTRNKASDRQQQSNDQVELLSSAPSSWQTMSAVEAPAAMLIAAGTRPAQQSAAATGSDLAVAASRQEESASSDYLRASSSTKGASYTSSVGETFSRLRQQGTKQQAYFYPQQQTSKTSQATKTHWYQPTTPRPAPIVQQEHYEQQRNDYTEQQQQQVEYGAAPLGQAEPFAFDFKTQDSSGNGQYRKEESDKNGVVRGSYGYTDANGIYRHVEYVADQNGFRANIKSNEPGLNGETQPASIQLAAASSPPQAGNQNSRLASPINESGNEWIGSGDSSNQPSVGSPNENLALAPPDFESSHKSDRIREPRHFRN